MSATEVSSARAAYQSELDQLRLQVELTGVRVDQNLEALSRIDDHAAVLGARLHYLFTGDPDHLAAEVR
jgi:hypothetical protein